MKWKDSFDTDELDDDGVEDYTTGEDFSWNKQKMTRANTSKSSKLFQIFLFIWLLALSGFLAMLLFQPNKGQTDTTRQNLVLTKKIKQLEDELTMTKSAAQQTDPAKVRALERKVETLETKLDKLSQTQVVAPQSTQTAEVSSAPTTGSGTVRTGDSESLISRVEQTAGTESSVTAASSETASDERAEPAQSENPEDQTPKVVRPKVRKALTGKPAASKTEPRETVQTPVAGATSSTPYEVYEKDGKAYYYVNKGDTLYRISRRFGPVYGVDLDQIRSMNELAPGAAIYPGQRLLIYSGAMGQKRSSSSSN